MKEKLYFASKVINVMFISKETDKSKLESEAHSFLYEEFNCHRHVPRGNIVLNEINKVLDIPKDWIGSLLWGSEKDICAEDFLEKNDEEYKEYVRLKKKFENFS